MEEKNKYRCKQMEQLIQNHLEYTMSIIGGK